MPKTSSITAINLRGLDGDLFKDDHLSTEEMPGSNSFAVSGTLADDAAMVANDMHLTLRVPNLWFRSRLIYSSTDSSEEPHDITGLSLPSVPLIIIGSNRHVAWSFTNSYGDFANWVRVRIDENDNTQYLGTAGWKPINEIREIIHIHGASNEELYIFDYPKRLT